MRNIHKILYLSFTAPFYRQISGALLFLFFALFAIQQNIKTALQFHYYIIISIVENPLTLLLLILLSALYTIKCISFFTGCKQKEHYTFVREINSLNREKIVRYLLIVSASMLAPVLIYYLLATIIALFLKNYFAALLILLLALSLTLLVAAIFTYILNNPDAFKVRRIQLFSKLSYPKSISWFLLSFMFTKQTKALFVVKLLSFLSLYYFVLHDESVFEERMLWLIFSLCIMAHGVIIYRNFYFLETELSFYRNMPLKNIQIFTSIFVAYIIICLPEYWALRGLAFMHGKVYSYLCMIISYPGILMLSHVLLYTDDMKTEAYWPLLAGVSTLFFFFSFSENKWLVPAVSFAGALIVFYTSFRYYEKNSDVKRLE